MTSEKSKITRVLVYPCASGVGQEIFFALQNHKDIEIYGANSGGVTPGLFLYQENYICDGPAMKDEQKCITWLQDIIKKKQIDFLFPAYDDAQVWLKEREEILGCKVVTSSVNTVQICRSKKKTYEALQAYIRCPFVYETKPTTYPVFIKPECGEGSKGCYKIDSEEQLDSYFTKDHITIEYLPGEEYTVDCLSDLEGNLLFSGARERVITRAGISILTKGIETTDEILRMAEKISKRLHCVGAWFFQIKKAIDGKMCLMEVAPRIPGAMAFHREQGINFASLSIDIHRGKSVRILQPRFTEGSYCCKIYTNYFLFPRAKPIQAFYLDLDDTLLLGPNINIDILRLVYLAKNRGIPVILLTRHKHDVYETLRERCIAKELFKKIVHLDTDTPKSKYIEKTPAIFIDDSFREREDVYNRLQDVVCFDVDSIRSAEGFLTTTPA